MQITPAEIAETLAMVSKQHLDIRTITLGLNLRGCTDADIDVMARKVYDRMTAAAERLVPTAEQLEQADILVSFAPPRTPPARGKLCLPLYAGAEEAFTWSAAAPGQGGEESRTALLAALWEVGALRPECLEVRSVTFRA